MLNKHRSDAQQTNNIFQIRLETYKIYNSKNYFNPTLYFQMCQAPVYTTRNIEHVLSKTFFAEHLLFFVRRNILFLQDVLKPFAFLKYAKYIFEKEKRKKRLDR